MEIVNPYVGRFPTKRKQSIKKGQKSQSSAIEKRAEYCYYAVSSHLGTLQKSVEEPFSKIFWGQAILLLKQIYMPAKDKRTGLHDFSLRIKTK
jgi:hypothetical protein